MYYRMLWLTTLSKHFRKTESGIIVNIKVIPRSSKTEISGVASGELRVKVTAPPLRGEANEQLKEALYQYISVKNAKSQGQKVKRRDIKIIKGERSKHKQVEIKGIDSI